MRIAHDPDAPDPMTKLKSSILLALALGASSSIASAAKVDKLAPLYQNMDAASQRYQEASIKFQAGDEASQAVMTKALEDLEDLAQACLKQRGCDTTRVITVYEAMVKARDVRDRQALVTEDPDEFGDPDHMVSPVLANSPEAVRSLALLDDGHGFDKLVQVNEPIQAALREWLTSQRAFLIDAWVNYQYMRYLMAPEYERAGLPEALLFGIMAKESGGKVHATSRAGASGPLQFMPATGTRFGLYRDETGFDSRFDPQRAARANAAYINERFAELNRNLEYTVAAYNGGEGRAARLYAGNAGASLWSPQVYAQLPQETRDYVPAVIAAAWLFLHPKKYGLQFPKVDTTPGQFTLVRAASINELTICLGNGGSHDGWFRVLRNLNPRYEAQATIPAGTVMRAPKQAAALYPRHCVQGPRSALAQELIRANKFSSSVAGVMVEGTAASSPASATASSGKSARRPGNYQVRSGDSLQAIAREHSCDVTMLAKANKLKSPNYIIRPGQRLKLNGCED
jgi:membrane-bound lytic murein transglycosylase D